MGEYEPRDSRNVTLKQKRAPGEPPRTGPREGETRQQHGQQPTELEQDERGEQAEQTVSVEQQQSDEEQERGAADDPARFDRND